MVIFCKVAGFCLVLFASGYFAYNINQSLEDRKQELRKLYNILLQLKSEIQYMSTTLPECFSKLSDNLSEPFLPWLNFLSEEMEKGERESFCDIWKNGLKVLSERSALCDEDLAPLYELSDKLGTMDVTAQLKAVDYALLHLEGNRKILEEEIVQKKKVVMTLSLFCGFMTLILLL